MTKLTIEELRNALKRLPDWELVKDREAIARVTRAIAVRGLGGQLAHPDLRRFISGAR